MNTELLVAKGAATSQAIEKYQKYKFENQRDIGDNRLFITLVPKVLE